MIYLWMCEDVISPGHGEVSTVLYVLLRNGKVSVSTTNFSGNKLTQLVMIREEID